MDIFHPQASSRKAWWSRQSLIPPQMKGNGGNEMVHPNRRFPLTFCGAFATMVLDSENYLSQLETNMTCFFSGPSKKPVSSNSGAENDIEIHCGQCSAHLR